MLKKLPDWCYSNTHPAFKDTESLTSVNMVAKLYSKMQDLINDYNKLSDEVTSRMDGFEDNIIEETSEFEREITKLMHDYIAMLDEKIKVQDKRIDELDFIVPDVPNIATTDYVTEEISKIEIPETSNMATTDYVDEQIANSITAAIGGEY